MPELKKIQVRSMGVHRNFSRGGTSTFCSSFPCCWRCNANACSQNALPFLHHNEYVPLLRRGVTRGAQFSGRRIIMRERERVYWHKH